MNIKTGFNKNFGKWFLTKVIRTINKYDLIRSNESIAVALSGGIDSMVLLYILYMINRYSYLHFDLTAIHIRTGEYDTEILKDFCSSLNIPYHEHDLDLSKIRSPRKKICYSCSRFKRGIISNLIKDLNITKVAYGHHADDVAETFFMNIFENRKLGSFSPRVLYRNNPLIVIRPMILLDRTRIEAIHQYAGLPVLDHDCPFAADNIRDKYRQLLKVWAGTLKIRKLSSYIVTSLENVDETNIWSAMENKEDSGVEDEN